MKTTTLLFLTLMLSFSVNSQSLLNSDFDSLCICAIDRVWYWGTSDALYIQNDTVQGYWPGAPIHNNSDIHISMSSVQFNYDPTDTLHHVSSIKLNSFPSIHYPNGDILKGFVVNGKEMYAGLTGYEVDFQKSGEPYSFSSPVQFMIGVKGEYKFENYTNNTTDYGRVRAIFTKYNSSNNSRDTLAYAESTNQLSATSQWQGFHIPFSVVNNGVPDTVTFIVESSTNGMDSTTLWVDNLEFEWNSVGVQEYFKSRLKAFPNPTTGTVQLRQETENGYSDFRNYEVLNAHGQVIKRVNGSTFTLENQPEGLYYVIHPEKDQQETLKILKVNE